MVDLDIMFLRLRGVLNASPSLVSVLSYIEFPFLSFPVALSLNLAGGLVIRLGLPSTGTICAVARESIAEAPELPKVPWDAPAPWFLSLGFLVSKSNYFERTSQFEATTVKGLSA